nr:MAG TPA: hypothetical protein [Caudoviricetes sp.]
MNIFKSLLIISIPLYVGAIHLTTKVASILALVINEINLVHLTFCSLLPPFYFISPIDNN